MRARTLLLAATFAAPALAQQTQITFEGSYDQGQTWHGGTLAVLPGATLLVRTRISLVNAGSQTVHGLAGIIFQPTLSAWTSGDARNPFSSEYGIGVNEDPQTNVGRINPFAAGGMTSAVPSGALTSHVDAGGLLRFAGANAVDPTTDLRWGVNCGQLPLTLPETPFRFGIDVVVFRYSVTLDPNIASDRVLVATTNAAHVNLGRATWYLTLNGQNRLDAPVTQDTIIPLHIVIPAPATLAPFAGALILAAGRRPRGPGS